MCRIPLEHPKKTYVIGKLGHEQLLVDGWELVFQALPGLVAGHKVCVAGRAGVQLLIKSIACSEPQRITGQSRKKESKRYKTLFTVET